MEPPTTTTRAFATADDARGMCSAGSRSSSSCAGKSAYGTYEHARAGAL